MDINSLPLSVHIEIDCEECGFCYWEGEAHDCREEYFKTMRLYGYAEHEIEEFWNSPSKLKILDASWKEGERWL